MDFNTNGNNVDNVSKNYGQNFNNEFNPNQGAVNFNNGLNQNPNQGAVNFDNGLNQNPNQGAVNFDNGFSQTPNQEAINFNDDFNQNNNMGGSFNQSQPKTKNNGAKIFLILFGILIILLIVAVSFASFKGEEQKFLELLTSKQSFVEWSEELNNKAEKSEEVDTKIEVNLDDFAEIIGEEISDNLTFGMELKTVNKDNTLFGTVALQVDSEDLINVNYANKDNLFGMKIEDTTEKMIAVRNDNLKDMLEKLGIEDTAEVPDRFLTQEDFMKVMKLDEKKLGKIGSKYFKVFLNGIKGKVTVDKDVELKINGKEFKANKHTLSMTQREWYNMTMSLLEMLKDDKENIKLVLDDIESILKLMEENGYNLEEMYDISIEDMKTSDDIYEVLEELYDICKEADDEIDDEKVIINVSVYEYKGKTISTEIDLVDFLIIKIDSVIDDKVYISFGFEDGSNEIKMVMDGKNTKDGVSLDFGIVAEGNEMKLFNIEQKYVGKTKEKVVKLDKKNVLILNDASEEEINEFMEEFMEGAQELGEEIGEKLEDIFPANDNTYVPFPGYDDNDIDDKFDDEYVDRFENQYDNTFDDKDNNYNEELNTTSFKKAQQMYARVNIGDTKADVIAKIGEPTDVSSQTSSYDGTVTEYLLWFDSDDVPLINVTIENGKVSIKRISIYSSTYDGVYIGKETGSTVNDLKLEADKLKKGMSLQEVKKILGDAIFESAEYDNDYIDYTFYDKKEQSIEIGFDKEGKVWFVGSIY